MNKDTASLEEYYEKIKKHMLKMGVYLQPDDKDIIEQGYNEGEDANMIIDFLYEEYELGEEDEDEDEEDCDYDEDSHGL